MKMHTEDVTMKEKSRIRHVCMGTHGHKQVYKGFRLMIKAFCLLCLVKYIRYAPSAGNRRLLPSDLASEKENQIELLEFKNVITKVNSVDKLIANQARS